MTSEFLWKEMTTVTVVASIGIFVYIELPIHNRGCRSSTPISQLKQTGTTLAIYRADYDGRLPHKFSTNSELMTTTLDYSKWEGMYRYNVWFEDGRDPIPALVMPNQRMGGLNVDTLDEQSKTVLVYGNGRLAEGWPVTYVDTHAEHVSNLDSLDYLPNFNPESIIKRVVP